MHTRMQTHTPEQPLQVLVQVLVLEGMQALQARSLHLGLVRVEVQRHCNLQLARPV